MLRRFKVSSIRFTSIGTGKFLATLRSDLKNATDELFIICPWLDEFFAAEIVKIGVSSLNIRLLMRPQTSVDPAMWPLMESAVNIFRDKFASSTVRTLDRLHAKCIILDRRICYIGSANFYWYSLNESREICLRGPLDEMGALSPEAEALWKEGVPYEQKPPKAPMTTIKAADGPKMTSEIIDPEVAEILRQNPKAWIAGRRSDKR
jgi:PLD-like domain